MLHPERKGRGPGPFAPLVRGAVGLPGAAEVRRDARARGDSLLGVRARARARVRCTRARVRAGVRVRARVRFRAGILRAPLGCAGVRPRGRGVQLVPQARKWGTGGLGVRLRLGSASG